MSHIQKLQEQLTQLKCLHEKEHQEWIEQNENLRQKLLSLLDAVGTTPPVKKKPKKPKKPKPQDIGETKFGLKHKVNKNGQIVDFNTYINFSVNAEFSKFIKDLGGEWKIDAMGWLIPADKVCEIQEKFPDWSMTDTRLRKEESESNCNSRSRSGSRSSSKSSTRSRSGSRSSSKSSTRSRSGSRSSSKSSTRSRSGSRSSSKSSTRSRSGSRSSSKSSTRSRSGSNDSW